MTKPKERFESDTQKIIHRHLEDEDHQITDEEIANVRIGMTPPIDEEDVPDTEEKVADTKNDSEADDVPGSQKVTPWDTLEP